MEEAWVENLKPGLSLSTGVLPTPILEESQQWTGGEMPVCTESSLPQQYLFSRAAPDIWETPQSNGRGLALRTGGAGGNQQIIAFPSSF